MCEGGSVMIRIGNLLSKKFLQEFYLSSEPDDFQNE